MTHLLRFLPVAGWPLALIMGWLALTQYRAVGVQIEACATLVAQNAADYNAELIKTTLAARIAAEAEHEAQVLASQNRAKRAEERAQDAELSYVRVRAEIAREKAKPREENDANACLYQLVPNGITDGLRNDTGRGEIGSGGDSEISGSSNIDDAFEA